MKLIHSTYKAIDVDQVSLYIARHMFVWHHSRPIPLAVVSQYTSQNPSDYMLVADNWMVFKPNDLQQLCPQNIMQASPSSSVVDLCYVEPGASSSRRLTIPVGGTHCLSVPTAAVCEMSQRFLRAVYVPLSDSSQQFTLHSGIG